MERTVLRDAPSYWNTNYLKNVYCELIKQSDEYNKIVYELKQAIGTNNFRINKIQRYQNVHDLGQVLIREQLMAGLNKTVNFYRVRRYVKVRKQYLSNALNHNLDYRRCGKANLVFHKYISLPNIDEVILVVQVITTNPNIDDIKPLNSSEYFIDYIVYM